MCIKRACLFTSYLDMKPGVVRRIAVHREENRENLTSALMGW